VQETKKTWSGLDVAATNSLLAASALSAAAGTWPEGKRRLPLLSLAIPVYVAFMHVYLLRKVLCRNCHYFGENCCTGWGKLAPLWCEKGDEEAFESGLPLAAAFWATYPLIGGGGILRAYRRDREKARLKHLAVFSILFAAFNLWHIRRACPYCYHREQCPKGKVAMRMEGNEA